MTSPGIYLAYPTTPELKPIYPCYKTLVNGEHTKLGIARRSFQDRERQYIRTFQGRFYSIPFCRWPRLTCPNLRPGFSPS